MQALLEFIRRYYFVVLFVILEIVSISLILRWSSYQRSLWFAGVTEVTGRVRSAEAEIHKHLQLAEINRQLTERNTILEHRIALLTTALNEARHDTTFAERAMLHLAADSASLIHANIVDATISRKDNFFVIDRGTRQGVCDEQGVICPQGIVGIVYMAADNYSVVMPVLHSKSSISCRLRGTGYFGYLHWEGGDALTAVVDDIPRHARVKVGDVVETSGFSAVFPAGLFVGRVASVVDSDDGLAYTLHVHLGTNFANLQNVIVINDRRMHTIKAAKDSIM